MTTSIESRLKKIEEELSRLKVHHAVVWLNEALESRIKEIEDKLMRKK
jgi:predicted DNA-binding protein